MFLAGGYFSGKVPFVQVKESNLVTFGTLAHLLVHLLSRESKIGVEYRLYVLQDKIKKAAATKFIVCYNNMFSLSLNFSFFTIAKMDLSQELTLYTGQNLTLSCQPRDSPKHLVYWYKGARNQKGLEKHFSTGPSFTITKATVDDTAFYSCSAAEWGFWGIRHYILVNVIGKRVINFNVYL